MPELPEVETVRTGLEKKIINKTINEIDVYWPPTVGGDVNSFVSSCQGQSIRAITRHGKKIYLNLLSQTLSIHLRMTGQLLFVPVNKPRGPYTRVEMRFRDFAEKVQFEDIRKFGRFKLEKENGTAAPDAWLAKSESLVNSLKRRHGMIKPALLNQSIIAGLGNIYVDEILYKTKIHPLKKIEKLSSKKISQLIQNTKSILATSIKMGGTSFRNYVDTQGSRGGFKNWLLVYAKSGSKCQCGSIIKKILVAQRGTHYCPRCQRI